MEPTAKWVLCNYDFQARNSSELSVKHQDVLEVRGEAGQGQPGECSALATERHWVPMTLSPFLQVLDDKRKWWKVRDPQGQEGYVPYNILAPYPGPPGDRSQSPARNMVSAGRHVVQILGDECVLVAA